ncbi:asparaginase [Thermanaerosceptrum fracticalcis]|uniref:Asparaginase n=2 Tax=Thermanaerosceptrum fracticalcis TaxID=1712410 RepID=A0A7G6E3D4_THEFR|nr:asparaginase [Thermanaerosceptrum fracticalcis]
MKSMEVVKLVEVTRGDVVESVHRGVVAVVDSEGKLVASAGDPRYLTYIRSAAKPMQAIPVLESGAASHYSLSLEEIAVLTASHSGEEEHVRVVMQVLSKIGLTAAYLQCGTHPPLHRPSAKALIAKGLEPTVLHCSCSGKHAGMLILTRFNEWNLDDYYKLEHPVQQLMLQCMADFAGLNPEEIPIGIDGCGVPVFAMTVEKMAFSYARLAQPESFAPERKEASLKLREAMTAYPSLVAGTGRLATDLMKVVGNKLVAKDGAEGVFCISVPAKGWGIALKIEDGHTRAVGPAVIAVLDQLGLITGEEKELLAIHTRTELQNFRKEVIGEIRPAFTLK